MARGMRRTTIMSHGRLHDAKGVRGTHLKGTVPNGEVLDAIPASANTVANLPETTLAGKAGEVTRNKAPVQVRTGKPRMDEGVPVIPGGNRDYRGPSTSRPSLEDVNPPAPQTRSSSGQVLATPEPTLVEDAPEKAPPVANAVSVPPPPPADTTPSQDEPDSAAAAAETSSLSAPLPTSKRKLARAKNELLSEWCAHLEIDPREYVEDDGDVTGDLMRKLIAEVQGIILE